MHQRHKRESAISVLNRVHDGRFQKRASITLEKDQIEMANKKIEEEARLKALNESEKAATEALESKETDGETEEWKVDDALSDWPYPLLCVCLLVAIFSIAMSHMYASVVLEDTIRWEDPNSIVEVPLAEEIIFKYGTESIPDIENYFHVNSDVTYQMNTRLGVNSNGKGGNDSGHRNCSSSYQKYYQEKILNNITHTDPIVVEKTIDDIGVHNHPDSLVVLSALLEAPVEIGPFLTLINSCVSSNSVLSNFACTVWDNEDLHINYDSDHSLMNTSIAQVTLAIVMNQLVEESLKNPAYHQSLLLHITGHNWQPILHTLEQLPPDGSTVMSSHLFDSTRKFLIHYTNLIFTSVSHTSSQPIGIQPTYLPSIEMLWSMNYEAAALSYENELLNHVHMTHVLSSNLFSASMLPSSTGQFKWRVGRSWSESFIMWQMTVASQIGRQGMYWSNAIPAVMCSSCDYAGHTSDNTITAHTLAQMLSLSASYRHDTGNTASDTDTDADADTVLEDTVGSLTNRDLSLALEDHLVNHTSLSPPAYSSMKYIFTLLDPSLEFGEVTDSGPIDPPQLSAKNYLLLQTILLTTVVVFTGLTGEIFLGSMWLQLDKSILTVYWKYSQCCFSLFLAIGVYSRSAFGLLFACLGLWKLFLPETLGCMVHCTIAWEEGHIAHSVAHFLDSIGTLVHHTGATYTIVAVMNGLFPLDRAISSIFLPLVVAHLAVILKYIKKPIYILVMLGVEAVWEWEAFSNIEHLHSTTHYTAKGTVFVMLVSHWMYFTAALLLMTPEDLRMLHPQNLVSNSNTHHKIVDCDDNDKGVGVGAGAGAGAGASNDASHRKRSTAGATVRPDGNCDEVETPIIPAAELSPPSPVISRRETTAGWQLALQRRKLTRGNSMRNSNSPLRVQKCEEEDDEDDDDDDDDEESAEGEAEDEKIDEEQGGEVVV